LIVVVVVDRVFIVEGGGVSESVLGNDGLSDRLGWFVYRIL